MKPSFNRGALAALAAVAAGVGACRGPDIDRLWSMQESRRFHASTAGIEKVEGTALGEYVIFVPQGVARQTLTLAATESLVIGDDVTVKEFVQPHAAPELGTVSSVGSLTVGAGSHLGALYALGDTGPQLGPGMTISMYGESVSPYEGFVPRKNRESLRASASPAVEEFRWNEKATGPAAPGVVAGAPGAAVRPLAPGAYASLVIPSGTTARLKSGSYFFSSLVVQPGGTLEIDNASGMVKVSVDQTLTIAGRMREYSRQPSTLIGYGGSASPDISTAFEGTLVAPNATIVLPATSEPHSGGFFARAIRVADHAVVEHRTFMGWELTFEDVPTACGLCALSADASMRRCCAKAYRASSNDPLSLPDGNGVAGAFDKHHELEECLSRVLPSFIACEERSYLVPEGCEELGHGYRPQLSCGSD
jgi:hypothetical protein